MFFISRNSADQSPTSWRWAGRKRFVVNTIFVLIISNWFMMNDVYCRQKAVAQEQYNRAPPLLLFVAPPSAYSITTRGIEFPTKV